MLNVRIFARIVRIAILFVFIVSLFDKFLNTFLLNIVLNNWHLALPLLHRLKSLMAFSFFQIDGSCC